MTKAQIQALITLSITLAACSGGSETTNAPDSDGGTSPDSGEPETPTSWTRTYKTISGEGFDLSQEWPRVPQSSTCLTSDGKVFFPGIIITGEKTPYGIILGPTGNESASFYADIPVEQAACHNDQIAVTGFMMAGKSEGELAGGRFANPVPDRYTPYLAGVGGNGIFQWGRGQDGSSSTTLIRQSTNWVWNVHQPGAIDYGCGEIPARGELGPNNLNMGATLGAFGPDGKCVWSWRIKQHSGLELPGALDIAEDGGDGVLVLLGDINKTSHALYDAAIEHFDASGNSLWITPVYREFGDTFWGKIVRSRGDGGYFIGRMLTHRDEHGAATIRQPIVTKLAADGTEQWTQPIATWAIGRLIAFAPDNDGGILVGGRFEVSSMATAPATICGQTFTPQTTPDGTGMDGFLAKFDDAGNCSWVKVYSTPQMDEVTAVLASPVDSTVVVFWEEWPVSEGYNQIHTADLHITKFRP